MSKNSHITNFPILFLKYMCNHDGLTSDFGFLLPVSPYVTSKQDDEKPRKTSTGKDTEETYEIPPDTRWCHLSCITRNFSHSHMCCQYICKSIGLVVSNQETKTAQ